MSYFNESKNIFKIVITGGPCGGKSEALKRIQQEIPKLGWKVLIIPETATELITSGIAPWTCSSNFQYHVFQIELHNKKEEIFERAAKDLLNHGLAENVLIVYDRGQPDAKSYLEDGEFEEICNILDIKNCYDKYDAVFHLESTAVRHSEFYTLENNVARHESVEEAIEQDKKTRLVWEGLHPNYHVIPSSENFNEKIDMLMSLIKSYLV